MFSVKNRPYKRRFQRFTVARDIEMQIHIANLKVNLIGKLVDVSYPFVGLRLTCSQEIPMNSHLSVERVKTDEKRTFRYKGIAEWCMQKRLGGDSPPFPAHHVGVSVEGTDPKNRGTPEEGIADLGIFQNSQIWS